MNFVESVHEVFHASAVFILNFYLLVRVNHIPRIGDSALFPDTLAAQLFLISLAPGSS